MKLARVTRDAPSPYAHAEDQERLVRAAEQGSAAAFEKLASRYDQGVLALMLALTTSEQEALELCQRTMLAAFRGLGARRTYSLYIWIYQLAVDQWLEWRKSNKPNGHGNGAAVQVQALLQLSPQERVVFELKGRQHLGLPTVAQILGIPVDAAGRAFSRAVCKMQMEMGRG